MFFFYYTTTYTITGVGPTVCEVGVGAGGCVRAFALELDAASCLRATVKFAPGTAAVVSDA